MRRRSHLIRHFSVTWADRGERSAIVGGARPLLGLWLGKLGGRFSSQIMLAKLHQEVRCYESFFRTLIRQMVFFTRSASVKEKISFC